MPQLLKSLPKATRIQTLAIGSIVVAVAVMAIKYVAYLKTGSVALYSDALESIVNVITAIAALTAIRVGIRPPDAEHPFGHHKAEYLSAVLEGALIIIAAIMILREAYDAFLNPRTLTEPALGLAINGFATALNAGWALLLIRSGRAWGSMALAADGKHILTDVVTSVGVFVGLVLAALTGWSILDPLLACAVAVNILWTGYKLAIESMSGLLDERASTEIEARIHRAIANNGAGALEAHDIRTRHAGRMTFIEFHLVVPGDMTVAAAHEICDRLEDAIEAELVDADVVIHVEPDEKAKPDVAIALNNENGQTGT
ncbi:MAG: cation diffusion facilitator family transporter [Hyphomicrobiaceae bacterium]